MHEGLPKGPAGMEQGCFPGPELPESLGLLILLPVATYKIRPESLWGGRAGRQMYLCFLPPVPRMQNTTSSATAPSSASTRYQPASSRTVKVGCWSVTSMQHDRETLQTISLNLERKASAAHKCK